MIMNTLLTEAQEKGRKNRTEKNLHDGPRGPFAERSTGGEKEGKSTA